MQFRHTKILILITLLLLLATQAQGLVAPGRITVYSTPSGAHACIDNADCDSTTATFTANGNAWHTVVVTSPGYLQWSDYVYVTSEQTAVVNAVLEANPATTGVQVYVNPGSGTVCLDNSQCHVGVGSRGVRSTTQFAGVSEGYHTVSVDSTPGYEDYSTQVYVTMGRIVSVNIDLVPVAAPATTATPATPSLPATGTVRVYVDHVGSTVCIDNGDCRDNVGGTSGPGSGSTAFSDVTANTAHTISVALDGYQPFSTQVSVREDEISVVDVTLEPLGTGTTAPVQTTSPPTPAPTRAGLGMLPVLGALALCGAVVLCRNNRD
jgi:hypothetical protein